MWVNDVVAGRNSKGVERLQELGDGRARRQSAFNSVCSVLNFSHYQLAQLNMIMCTVLIFRYFSDFIGRNATYRSRLALTECDSARARRVCSCKLCSCVHVIDWRLGRSLVPEQPQSAILCNPSFSWDRSIPKFTCVCCYNIFHCILELSCLVCVLPSSWWRHFLAAHSSSNTSSAPCTKSCNLTRSVNFMFPFPSSLLSRLVRCISVEGRAVWH